MGKANRLRHRAISGEGDVMPSGARAVEIMVHFSPVAGQRHARTLCGWEGGNVDGETASGSTCSFGRMGRNTRGQTMLTPDRAGPVRSPNQWGNRGK